MTDSQDRAIFDKQLEIEKRNLPYTPEIIQKSIASISANLHDEEWLKIYPVPSLWGDFSVSLKVGSGSTSLDFLYEIIPLGINLIQLRNLAGFSTSVASVASVAEAKESDVNTAGCLQDEAAFKLRNKIKEVGLPAIPCIFCCCSDPIEFDLVNHHLECHKPELFKLPIGKGSMEIRAEYAVNLAKQKLMEASEKGELGDGQDQ